jgi:hypothetical protein
LFKDRLLISLKNIGISLLYILTIPICVALLILIATYYKYVENIVNVLKWIFIIPTSLFIGMIVVLIVWCWIDWQFIEPYRKWKSNEN